MPIALNRTHDPVRRSWVDSANDAATDFPLQNLPLGLYAAHGGAPHPCTAIGDHLLDISSALDHGFLAGDAAAAARVAGTGGNLNALIAAGQAAAGALRAGLSDLLGADNAAPDTVAGARRLLIPRAGATMLMPVAIGGYTDFLCSLPHSTRMGRALRPDSPLPPAFKYLPIAYNGRASSVAISGTALRRPLVQRRRGDGTAEYGPSNALDYELELAAFLSGGNALGAPVDMAAAAASVFGYVLLNDWSARDIQRWESAPLGPFLGKSMLSTISPWIVTDDALAPFRCPAARPATDPAPFPYLTSADNEAAGGLDLVAEAHLVTPRARAAGEGGHLLTRTRFAGMYWTFAQMVTHHASNGCPMRAGDMIGSGTMSDATDLGRACLTEMEPDFPIALPGGEQRHFLEDGDEIILSARATRDGAIPIGFGACRGVVVAQ